MKKWKHVTSLCGRVNGIRVGKFNISVASSAFIYQLEDLLIDSGPINQWNYVCKFAEEYKIKRILLTHHHEDHSGNARNLKDKVNATVYSSKLTQDLLYNGFKMEPFRHILFGHPPSLLTTLFPENNTIQTNEYGEIHIVPTPGHSIDHNIFYLPKMKWIFSGDLLVTTKPTYGIVGGDPINEIKSISYILDHCTFSTVFCAHKGIVHNGRELLRNKLNHMLCIQERVKWTKQKFPKMNINEMTKIILGREDWTYFFTSCSVSKKALIKGFLLNN